MTNDLLCKIALTLIPGIGSVQAKILIENFGDAPSVFSAKESQLKKMEGIGEIRAKAIKSFADFTEAEEEIKFIEKYKILPLFITDKDYPKRLLNCYDSPTLLYYKGTADLNAPRIISIVGTRNNTDYGKQVTENLITELAEQNILIVSGLAFGIDAIAHKSALKNNMATVGVLAHGLDKLYPTEHTGLAKDMLKKNGGLLTEFRSKSKPDKHNFPTRNRIVAGMSDATVVVETGIKGGSMITAELANGYNKEVFAIPGKIIDTKSSGCNYLIKSNKAALFTDAGDLLEAMNWLENKKTRTRKQKEILIELDENEKIIVNILKEKEAIHIDELNIKSNLNSSTVAAAVLNLELQNVILSLPGKLYRLA